MPTPFHTGTEGCTLADVLIKPNSSQEGLTELGAAIQGVVGAVSAVRIPLDSLAQLTPFLMWSLSRLPTNYIGVPAAGVTTFRDQSGEEESGVIIWIIDTQIEFHHGDFIDSNGDTRILFPCGRTDSARAGDNTCPGNGTANGGTLWMKAQIDATLPGGGTIRQTATGGHSSHVLKRAAGDDTTYGGMTPGADIIMVKTSFSTTDIIGGLSFMDQKTANLGSPSAINMSLGVHFSPHDGTDSLSAAINGLVGPGKPEKAVVVAAGNERTDKIHASGNVSSGPQSTAFTVPSQMIFGRVEIWYDGQDIFTVDLPDPGNNVLVAGIGPGVSSAPNPSDPFRCTQIGSSNTCYRVDHSVPQSGLNGDVEIVAEIATTAQSSDTPGTYGVRLNRTSVSVGTFDVWITCPFAFCEFPSGDTPLTVGSPRVATNAITAGSYVTRDCWPSTNDGTDCYFSPPTVGAISDFSCKSPTRDGGQTPEFAAPGEGIASALSIDASYTNIVAVENTP